MLLCSHLRDCKRKSVSVIDMASVWSSIIPSRAITTIFETRAHSSRNSSTHLSTSSERKDTIASVVSYMIRLEGRITLLPARLPTGCCTYLSFTHVTT